MVRQLPPRTRSRRLSLQRHQRLLRPRPDHNSPETTFHPASAGFSLALANTNYPQRLAFNDPGLVVRIGNQGILIHNIRVNIAIGVRRRTEVQTRQRLEIQLLAAEASRPRVRRCLGSVMVTGVPLRTWWARSSASQYGKNNVVIAVYPAT